MSIKTEISFTCDKCSSEAKRAIVGEKPRGWKSVSLLVNGRPWDEYEVCDICFSGNNSLRESVPARREVFRWLLDKMKGQA